jgi:hypothetical protein
MANASAPSVVRKSAHGRTQLFLPSANTVLREVECMGGITRYDSASVYHTLPPARDAQEVACWHCAETISGKPIPLPRIYDSAEGVFHVYGATCCPGCAKAYILEHTAFDRSHHLNVLVRFLREVYGIHGPVIETPPRPALRRFGGPFDPRTQPRSACTLVEPPFVSYCMLAEERVVSGDTAAMSIPDKEVLPTAPVEDPTNLEEPAPPPMFATFTEMQPDADGAKAGRTAAAGASMKRRRTGSNAPTPKVAQPPPAGPLARFITRRDEGS